MESAHGWSPEADDLSAREIDLPAHWIASRIGREDVDTLVVAFTLRCNCSTSYPEERQRPGPLSFREASFATGAHRGVC